MFEGHEPSEVPSVRWVTWKRYTEVCRRYKELLRDYMNLRKEYIRMNLIPPTQLKTEFEKANDLEDFIDEEYNHTR